MENYIIKFNEAIEEINSGSFSKIISVSRGFSQRPAEYISGIVELIQTLCGYTLPKDLLSGIEVSGFHINWQYEIDEARRGGGELWLRDLMEVFGGNIDYQNEKFPTNINAVLKQLSIIDEHPETGDDQFAAFRLEGPDKMPPEIWYWNRGIIFKMNLTYDEYLDALLALKGVNYWHFLFVDIIRNDYYDKYYNKTEYEHICNKLGERINDLEFLFPKVDLSKYKQLLDELRKKVAVQFA